MTRHRPRSATRRPRGRAGVTLIELMIALFIIGVALLGLAGFSASVTRQLGGGGRQTLAATRVQSRLDSLSSIAPCSNVASAAVPLKVGTYTNRGVRESWVIRDGNNVIYVTDTVSFRGRTAPLVYHSILVCRN
jgi:prepilin-type N-terminal cleavage/methylation domain-containing protein